MNSANRLFISVLIGIIIIGIFVIGTFLFNGLKSGSIEDNMLLKIERQGSGSDWAYWNLTGRNNQWNYKAYRMKYSSEGGGGCIAHGTDILLADGVNSKKYNQLSKEIGLRVII